MLRSSYFLCSKLAAHAAIALFLLPPTIVFAQSPRITQQGMELILSSAKEICLEVSMVGGVSATEVDGNAAASIAKLTRGLVDLGIEGAGRLEEKSFENVFQKDLAKDREDTRACRERIFDAMFARVFGDTPETILSDTQLSALKGQVRPHDLGVVERDTTQFVLKVGTTAALLDKRYTLRIEQIRESRNYVTIRWARLFGNEPGSGSVNVTFGGAQSFNGCMLSPYSYDLEEQTVSVLMNCE